MKRVVYKHKKFNFMYKTVNNISLTETINNNFFLHTNNTPSHLQTLSYSVIMIRELGVFGPRALAPGVAGVVVGEYLAGGAAEHRQNGQTDGPHSQGGGPVLA